MASPVGAQGSRFARLLTRGLRSQLVRWVVVVIAITLVTLGYGLRPVVDLAVGSILKNVMEPDDAEMPVTVTSYPSAPHVVSIIGGRGEGLNCSLPRGIDYLFDRLGEGHNSSVRQRFRQACVFHDLCYRHGLATYGYTQNQCDQMLQEQAFRICAYVDEGRSGLRKCQLDAKKVMAGVRVGGFKSYHGWGSSTYFEFDSNPSLSEHFSVARVVDHPFKAVDPVASAREPEQLFLSFDIRRSGATAKCRNCPDRKFTRDELRAAGLLPAEPAGPTAQQAGGSRLASATSAGLPAASSAIPEDLDRLKFGEERTVWLPLRHFSSAPHLISQQEGEQALVWSSRQRSENSVSCIAMGDPKNLLTRTVPKEGRCLRPANSHLKLAAVDLLNSSPQLAIIPPPPPPAGERPRAAAVVATGLTMQRIVRPPQITGSLHICVSADVRTTARADQSPNCFSLHDAAGEVASELGAFQNFPIIKGQRQIYLSRATVSDGRGHDAARGRALVFDLDHQHLQLLRDGGRSSPPVKLVHDRQFLIGDEFDPMMPMSRSEDDLRLLSVRSASGKAALYEIDLAEAEPQPRAIAALEQSGSTAIDLHASWIHRPVLVIEGAQPGGAAATQLLLSRSKVTTAATGPSTKVQPPSAASPKPTDTVDFEFLVLEKRKDAPAGTPWRYMQSLQCRITYTFQTTYPFQPCSRPTEGETDDRATPATKLQGAQLLTGRFRNGNASYLALADACWRKPIFLQTSSPGGSNVPFQTMEDDTDAKSQRARKVECRSLAGDRIASAM
jgi:hypothetical protein